MAFDKRGLDDYVQVNERIIAFRKQYPEGSLQSEIVKVDVTPVYDPEAPIFDKYGKVVNKGVTKLHGVIIMRGLAYRTPDDARPGIGHSQLQLPGPTPYTRESEIENAETSAWGRALAALGFEVKRSIASAEEIANKKSSEEQIPIRQMVNKLEDEYLRASMPSKAGRPEVNDVVKDRTGLVVVPDRVPPPESAIAKTLTPAQTDMMLSMLKFAQMAGHDIGNWLTVWGLGKAEHLEQLTTSPSVEGNVYAKLTLMPQDKGKERFEKGRDHYVPKDRREGLVWPE